MEKSPKNKGGRTESLKWLSFGDKIIRLMRERGIRSPALVEKSKVPARVLQKARQGLRVPHEHLEQIALGLNVKVEDIGKPIPDANESSAQASPFTNTSVLAAANWVLAENTDAADVLARLTVLRKDDPIAEFILLHKNPLKHYFDLILDHLDRDESAKLSNNARRGLHAFKDFATMLTLPLKDLETVHTALEQECMRVDAKCNETFVSYLVIARVLAEKVPAASRSRSIESLAKDDCSLSITERNDQWLIPIVNVPQTADTGEFDGSISPFTKGLASLFPIPTTTADPVKEINRRLGEFRDRKQFVAAFLPYNQQVGISTIHKTFPLLIVIVLPQRDDELYTQILGWRQNIEARINKAKNAATN